LSATRRPQNAPCSASRAEYKKPKLIAPSGACDTHLHVYGPSPIYPLATERNYTPDPRSTLDDYLRVHRALGLERAVIVTGSANGTNNQVTLDSLARMGGKFKGLALLEPAIGHAELLRLKNSGITGFRVKSNGKGGLSFESSKKISARVPGFNWHVEFLPQSMQEVIAAVPFLRTMAMPYVFDHVAHAEPGYDSGDHEFCELLAILKKRGARLDQSLQFLSTIQIRPAGLRGYARYCP
jgi:predicted TIM-barrel fold metal-dependent hydrolase